jgi:hypothetical protein
MHENAKNSRPTWDESYIHSRGTTQISAALIEVLKAQQLRVPPIKDGRAVNASFALFPYLTDTGSETDPPGPSSDAYPYRLPAPCPALCHGLFIVLIRSSNIQICLYDKI